MGEVSFEDLDESAALYGPAGLAPEKAAPATVFEFRPKSRRVPNPNPPKQHPCEKCNGKGWVTFGYVNVQTGKCFKCNGKGYFANSAADRAAKRNAAQERRNAEAAKRQASAKEFLEARPEISKWFAVQVGKNEFARSLWEALHKYGELTPRQLECVEASIEKQKAREAEWAARDAAKAQDPSALRLTLPAGMYAVPGGETRLKVRIDKPDEGKWAGFVFVKDGAEYGQQQRYGMQKPGGVYVGKIEEELRIIQSDPRAAAVAYGRLTGSCACCGRKLENAESVEAGIGPKCAAKNGW